MSESIIGKKFGKLTVIKDDGTRANPRAIKWLCKCDCGNTTHVVGNKLKTGHTKSCGCAKKEFDKWNYKDLSGLKFGRLTVLRKHSSSNGRAVSLCECSCGKVVKVLNGSLTAGRTKSCGCYKKEQNNKDFLNNLEMVEGTNLSLIKSEKLWVNNTSGVKGVSRSSGKKGWVASITYKREFHYLGYFENKQDAINARLEAEEKYFKPILEKYDIKKTDKHARKVSQ